MMNARELIHDIRATPDCVVFPPAGLPRLKPEHVLPADSADFYSLCGGLVLFRSIAFPVTILPPDRVKLANPQIALLDESVDSGDISWSWYTVAEDGNGDYFTLDCAPGRLGRCYNSFHETHGLAGQTPVVAWTMIDFIVRMKDLISSCSTDDYHWPSRIHELDLADAYEWTGAERSDGSATDGDPEARQE
ncbi:MAG: SMI1/KNR4 family protein [Planctomycetota bacterium]|jgi:hypothetical protein